MHIKHSFVLSTILHAPFSQSVLLGRNDVQIMHFFVLILIFCYFYSQKILTYWVRKHGDAKQTGKVCEKKIIKIKY